MSEQGPRMPWEDIVSISTRLFCGAQLCIQAFPSASTPITQQIPRKDRQKRLWILRKRYLPFGCLEFLRDGEAVVGETFWRCFGVAVIQSPSQFGRGINHVAGAHTRHVIFYRFTPEFGFVVTSWFVGWSNIGGQGNLVALEEIYTFSQLLTYPASVSRSR